MLDLEYNSERVTEVSSIFSGLCMIDPEELDECIIGLHDDQVIYHYSKLQAYIMRLSGCDFNDAVEHISSFLVEFEGCPIIAIPEDDPIGEEYCACAPPYAEYVETVDGSALALFGLGERII